MRQLQLPLQVLNRISPDFWVAHVLNNRQVLPNLCQARIAFLYHLLARKPSVKSLHDGCVFWITALEVLKLNASLLEISKRLLGIWPVMKSFKTTPNS